MNEAISIVSPNTGQVFDHWTPMSETEVGKALEAADAGFPALEKVRRRSEILDHCAAALRAERERLAALVVQEVGKKPSEARDEVEYAASFFTAAGRALESYSFVERPAPGREIQEVPYRSALLVAPYNDPLAGLTRKIAPALAAGAPALVKPSRLAVLCAGAVVDVLREAAAGELVQLVMPKDNGTVEALIADHRIGVISFTGSTEVGRRLGQRAAEHGKHAILELGGNCPFVICQDAGMELALEDLLVRKLKAAGQACSSVNRVYVAAGRYQEFRERLLDRVARLRLGPSDRAGVDLGPLRTAAFVQRLIELGERATAAGERWLTGKPAPPPTEAAFLYPFSVLETDQESLLDDHESFGPLLSIRPFGSLERLLRQLERERHALVAYFYSADPETLLPQLRRLRFGSIGVNSTAVQGPDVPTGGFWSAGMGREGGVWGIREFLAPMNYRIAAKQ